MRMGTKFMNPIQSKSVLQVVTYIGSHGEYGGPITVARTLANELSIRDWNVTLIGATGETYFEDNYEKHYEIRFPSKSLSKKYKFSSIISCGLILKIFKEVRNHRVIHLHFARDLVPIITALISIFLGKKFVLQTHGMIRKDDRFIVKLLDRLIVYICSKASTILYLTEIEKKDLISVGIEGNFVHFRNGLEQFEDFNETHKYTDFNNEIIFVSRINHTKRPEIVLEIAKEFYQTNPELSFSIYGPDDGALPSLIEKISESELSANIKYGGSLTPKETIEVIRKCSLVLLPSIKDPFPMIVLEGLRIGKPVLVSPDCGQAEILRRYDERFVSSGHSASDYSLKIRQLIAASFLRDCKSTILKIFNSEFEVNTLISKLEDIYADE